MFKSKTVFVLGAGSSNEIGFPLGYDLKATIADELRFRFTTYRYISETGDRLVCEALVQHMKATCGDQLAVERDVFDSLARAASKIMRGMSQAPSIDNYMDAHADDNEIVLCGKLAIARAILLAERNSLFKIDKDYPDKFDHDAAAQTWYGKLFQVLVTGISKNSLDDLLKNVSFITFNYDRSLERYLPFAIDNYYHCGMDHAVALVRKARIFHPYGICGRLPWQSSGSVPYGGSDYSPELLSVANQIQTFSERISDQRSVSEIKNEIATAGTIVFLGFGFHEMNMELLAVAQSNANRAFGTAWELSSSDVTAVKKRINQALNKGSASVELRNDLRSAKLFDEYRFGLVA